MINKQKIISNIENIIYNFKEKNEADILFNNYISLINYLDLDNYKLNIINKPLSLKIKHKAFNKNIILTINNNKVYINNEEINASEINKILHRKIFF